MANQSSPINPQKSLVNLNRLADGTIEIEAIIAKEEIKKEFELVLSELQKTTEIKGFRKGKAPRERVQRVVGQDAIYQKVINQLLPKIYQQTIEQQQLKPIISPRAELVSAQEGSDWKIKFVTCELPEINLNNYKETIKKTAAKESIWTPEKAKKETKKEDESLTRAKRFQTIIDTLAQTVQVVLPQILIDSEVNQRLANLIEKTEKMGLSIEQYLNTINKTADSIRGEYRQESEKNWRLELALNKISDEEKIVVSDQDIESALDKIKDKKEKDQLSNQRYLLSSMIRRQKTLEFLQDL